MNADYTALIGERQAAQVTNVLRNLLSSLWTALANRSSSALDRDDDGRQFRLLAENSADVICRIGPDMRAQYFSPSLTRLFGWGPEELIGTRPDAIILAEDLPIIAAAAARQFAGEVDSVTTTFRLRRKDGTTAWVEGTARTSLDPVTRAPGDTVLVMRDITDRKALEDKLSEMALTDSLTGLANRRAFDETLEREWQRTLAEGSHMSLLLIDLDRFKSFNDQYGHQVGDDCLRTIAATLKGALRHPDDKAARYGGEELAAILPSTDAIRALEVAEQVRVAVEALRLPHGGNLDGGFVTASIGVATAISRVGGTIAMPEGLLSAADTALYKAKHRGRNRVEVALLMTPDASSKALEAGSLPTAAQG